MCAAATLLTALPALLQQLRSPTRKGLLLCMSASAFSFFLFSYQVHEKSILLALLPITLLAPDLPLLSAWMPALAAFSMFPLLKKDGLSLAYVGVLLFWAAFSWPDWPALKQKAQQNGGWHFTSVLPVIFSTSFALALGLHAAAAFLEPPKRLPFIFDALITVLSFLHFACAAVYVHFLLWRQCNEKIH